MSENKRKNSQSEFDIFIANSVFPEATPLFATYLKSVEEIKDLAVIVLDTNALLVPYNIGKESLAQIQETYRRLVENEQLKVPGQVAREFATNRANKILEVFQQLNRKRSSVPSLQKGKYPLLESVSEYQEIVRLEREIDNLLKQYRKAIGNVLDHIRMWTWNDPVSSIYSELFNDRVIFDPTIDKEKAKAELSRRQLHRIPPGYKDASKDDSGIGDLLIWFTILEIGKDGNRDLIFVSSDQKTDWWHRSEGQALYPRYELVDEYRRETGGCSFHIIQFSRFLDLYGASESTVEEVREEEKRISAEFSLVGEFVHKWQELEQAMLAMYRALNPEESQRWRSVSQILRFLIHKDMIDADIAGSLKELSHFRNVLVHERQDFSDTEIRKRIIRLDEILDQLWSSGEAD